MHRFFVDPALMSNGVVTFPADVAHQLRSVLRMPAGAEVVVLDHSGDEYDVVLTTVNAGGVTGEVTARRRCAGEPAGQLTLYQALLKRDHFEWVLQKGTEIGVSRFVPVVSMRSVVKAVRPNKLVRWQRILAEAAEQCRRGRVPALAEPVSFETAVGSVTADVALLPWEESSGSSVTRALADSVPGSVALFIGPEGGFDAAEVARARAHGAQPVTLGRRILRAETAAIVAATLVMQALGELE